ncbi:Kinase interacting (KIP1-like) family protein [Zostera marina]|uniref:Kinase interacting (KIP1-like) family protein n=1 Tax=Zostera marina TaxID=29655 RepID=A0A0K9NTX8_ZOSMR|nr:Kinase interacting (KIP1-like) family protein [Zostera marina]
MVAIQKPSPYSWWFDSHNSPRQSPWLTSSLADLDRNTKAMLRLIEENADSFAERAEMYYKKRPQLIDMVENFYRTHRSLAEQFDQIRNEPRRPPSSSHSDESDVEDPEDVEERNEEVERLKEENEGLKAELADKDEQKREVIRQLCMSMDFIKEENMKLKNSKKTHKKGFFFTLFGRRNL